MIVSVSSYTVAVPSTFAVALPQPDTMYVPKMNAGAYHAIYSCEFDF